MRNGGLNSRGQYSNMLPCSLPIDQSRTTMITTPGGTSSFQLPVTMAQLCPDIVAVSGSTVPRTVVFNRFDITIQPNDLSSATYVTPSFQFFAVSDAGFFVPLCRPKEMSLVNPTRLTCNVPLWLTSPYPATATIPILLCEVRFPTTGTVSQRFTLTFRARGRISTPEITNF